MLCIVVFRWYSRASFFVRKHSRVCVLNFSYGVHRSPPDLVVRVQFRYSMLAFVVYISAKNTEHLTSTLRGFLPFVLNLFPPYTKCPTAWPDAKAWANVFYVCFACFHTQLVLNMMKSPRNGKPLGALSCVPQYMIYPEFFRQFDFHEIHYYLNEENGWTHDTRRMQRALEESRPYCDPRCLAIVNPANPTGLFTKR